MSKSKNNGTNLIISFGAVIAIGLTMAIYKILTSTIAATAIEILIVVIVSIAGIGLLMGLSFVGIRINHMRRTYKIESEAKLSALRTLQGDNDPQVALAILHGIPKQRRKEIESPNIVPQWRILDRDEKAEITDGDHNDY